MSTHLKELLCHHKMKCVECIKEVHDKIITNSFFFHAFGPSVIDNPVSLLYCCVHMTYVLATRYLYSSTSSHHFIYVSMFRDRVLFPPFSLGQNSRVDVTCRSKGSGLRVSSLVKLVPEICRNNNLPRDGTKTTRDFVFTFTPQYSQLSTFVQD